MSKYEVGVVYTRGGCYLLAVSTDTLITFEDGEPREAKPSKRGVEAVRSLSVEQLCTRWGVTLDALDKATAKYLAPSIEGIQPRPRGSRRRRAAADEFAWKEMRTIRLLHAG
ncbi:MAG: hypothetical protein KDD82_16380 [Planctomycetes bacterium]|nr:hypothetical protein [Planctomycetota bacterium]